MAGEVVAVLMPELDGENADPRATVILRHPNGSLEARLVDPEQVLADRILSAGCVSRGAPILDPTSRKVVGYELESFRRAG